MQSGRSGLAEIDSALVLSRARTPPNATERGMRSLPGVYTSNALIGNQDNAEPDVAVSASQVHPDLMTSFEGGH